MIASADTSPNLRKRQFVCSTSMSSDATQTTCDAFTTPPAAVPSTVAPGAPGGRTRPNAARQLDFSNVGPTSLWTLPASP